MGVTEVFTILTNFYQKWTSIVAGNTKRRGTRDGVECGRCGP